MLSNRDISFTDVIPVSASAFRTFESKFENWHEQRETRIYYNRTTTLLRVSVGAIGVVNADPRGPIRSTYGNVCLISREAT